MTSSDLPSTSFTFCKPFQMEFFKQLCSNSGADPGVQIGGGHMASAEREPIMGVCAPSGVQGQSPWSGGKAP